MKPFEVEAGLLFGLIDTQEKLEQLIRDQMDLAKQSYTAAEFAIGRLRLIEPRPLRARQPLFGDGAFATGQTLKDFLTEP